METVAKLLKNGNVCEDAHESLLSPWPCLLRLQQVPLWIQPPLGLGRLVASSGEHYLAFKRVSLAMGWCVPRATSGIVSEADNVFFFGRGFWMELRLPLRQDSGDRLLPPPKGFRVPAGRGWDTATSRSGRARRKVMLLWQARGRGFRIHRGSSKSGPVIGFSAT